jgi:hypothetical protein
MPQSRRVIRRVEPSAYHTFDEDLWPINVALIVLAGIAAGMIIGVSDLNDPRWYYNGWFRLGTLIVTTSVLIGSTFLFSSSRSRRGIQLAAVLSLLVHMIVVGVLYNQRLTYAEESVAASNATVYEPAVTLPDYNDTEEVLEEHEQPVATESVQDSQDQLPIERQEADAENVEQGQPAPVPGITPDVAPTSVERKELSDPAPSQPEESPSVQRNLTTPDLRLDDQITAPQSEQPKHDEPAAVETQLRPVERTVESTPEATKSVDASLPEAVVSQQTPSLGKRELQKSEAPSVTMVAPEQSRATSNSPSLTTTEIELPESLPSAGGKGLAETIESHVTATTKSKDANAVAEKGDSPEPAIARQDSSLQVTPTTRADLGQQTAQSPQINNLAAQPSRAVGSIQIAESKPEAPAASGTTADEPSAAPVERPRSIEVGRSEHPAARSMRQPDEMIVGEATPRSSISTARQSVRRADRSAEARGQQEPSLAIAPAGPRRATRSAELPTQPVAAVESPVGKGPTHSLGKSTTDSGVPALPGPISSETRRAASPAVEVATLDRAGGVRIEATPSVGSINRPARRDRDTLQTGTARFLSRSASGPLAIDGRAREPAEAYRRRRGHKLDPLGEYGQPFERTEEAVELGLQFLARHQSPNGSWSLHNYGNGKSGYERETSQLRSDTAATGLALLAFLGAGYDHYDDEYAGQIRRGLEFLVKNQKADGDLFLPMDNESNKNVWLYSHGIATIALCEAVGMTGDADLREPAQKAIDFIVKAQNKDRGGWRYVPGLQSDTSVSGWQLMALKSGELAGLKVPKETYEGVERWLDVAESSPGGQTQYAYNPFAPLQTAPGRFADHGRRPTPATTSMGLLMRLYMGWNRNDPRLKSGCDFLLKESPAIRTGQASLRDSYYWYYATQLMFHMKGDYWKQWNSQLHPMLVNEQVQSGMLAGSWDPRRPVPDRWGVQGGRIYVTTLNLLSLEVYYRHLPIYEETAK